MACCLSFNNCKAFCFPLKAIINLKPAVMKKQFLFVIGLLFATVASANTSTYYGHNKPFIFVEAGIEYAVFKDGQFDFNIIRPQSSVSVNINTGPINFSFNSGHNYDAFVQYDDYGAVVQIERTPIYYDYYGRVNRIGNIQLHYNNFGYADRIGRLNIFYNTNGIFDHCSGYVNSVSINYGYRPHHRYYRVPVVEHCVVYNRPYRQYYRPNRYSYTTYRNNYHVGYYSRPYLRRSYHRPGYRINRGYANNGHHRGHYKQKKYNDRGHHNGNRNYNRQPQRQSRTYTPRRNSTNRSYVSNNNASNYKARSNSRSYSSNNQSRKYTPRTSANRSNNNASKNRNYSSRSSQRQVASNSSGAYRRR